MLIRHTHDDLQETILPMTRRTQSLYDFFDTFDLPAIMGEEDVERVEHFQEAAPTVFNPPGKAQSSRRQRVLFNAGNRANEAGILQFAAGVDDHQATTAKIEADAAGIAELHTEPSRSPLKV